MRTWLRVVLAPEAYFGALVGYLAMTAIPEVFGLLDGAAIRFPLQSPFGLTLLWGLAAAYGVYRVAAFHPSLRLDYRRWLRQTPWRYGLPLPLGPVHLVWQDALYVAGATALSYIHADAAPTMIPKAFGIAYLLMTTIELAAVRQAGHAYALAFGLGGLPLVWSSPMGMAALLAGLCLIAWHGNRAGLRRFSDWQDDSEGDSWVQANMTQEAQRKRLLGWPFDRLSPQRDPFSPRTAWVCAAGVLLGWWTFSALTAASQDGRGIGMVLAIGLGLNLAFVRLLRYVMGYAPPISLLGRLVTFRWIIPRYDIVFATPAFMVFLAVTSVVALMRFHLPPQLVAPLLVAVEVIAAAAFPPSIDEWRLTGEHRIVPAAWNQTNELQQTP